MPGMEFPRPRPDRPIVLSPQTWSNLVAKVHSLERRVGRSLPSGHASRDGGVVWVQNDGDAIELGYPVALDRPQVLPDADGDTDFVAMQLSAGLVFTRGTMAPGVQFGIAIEPIAAGAAGRVRVDGVCLARLYVQNEDHRFAVPGSSDTQINSSDSGPAYIIWREGGTGEQWGVVRIGSPFPEGEADDNAIYGQLLSSLPAGGSATMAVLHASGPAGHNVVVHDNLMASGQSLAAGSICWAHWHSVDQRWYVYAVDACPDGDGVVIRNHGDLVGLNGDHHLHYSLRDGSRWTTTQTPSRVAISNVDGHLVCSTITTTELAALEGIQGNIEARIHELEESGGGTFTANRLIVSDSNGALTASTVTATEASYLAGVESAIQTQIDGKADKDHGHTIADVSGLQSELDGKAATSHGHAISDVTGLQTALDGKASTSHSHAIADVTGLQTALDGKASATHSHAISDVTGLQTALDGIDGALAAALTKAVNTVTTSGSLTTANRTVLANNSAAITLNLPPAATMAGDYLIVKKISNNAHTVTLDPNGSETIDGATTYVLYVVGDYVIIQSDGSNWRVIGGYALPHQCVMRRTTAKSIASTTITLIDGLTVMADTAALAGTDKIVIRRTGRYLIVVSGDGPTFSTSDIWQIYAYRGAAAYGTASATGAAIATTCALSGVFAANLTAGDEITLRALQYNPGTAARDLSNATLAVLEQR